MVYYHVIVAPYVRSVGHVFAYLYTLDDDSERPMDNETSLHPKVFPNDILTLLDSKRVTAFLLDLLAIFDIVTVVPH